MSDLIFMSKKEAQGYLSDDLGEIEYVSPRAFKLACREIIRLNEVIEGMKAENPDVYAYVGPSKVLNVPICSKCGAEWQQVRPGKWQCPECE